jgi:hypothetical protein
MSGSPIVSDSGAAVGVIVSSSTSQKLHGPNPRLVRDLPGWLTYAQPKTVIQRICESQRAELNQMQERLRAKLAG